MPTASDLEITKELRKYVSRDDVEVNLLNLDSIVNNRIRFVAWVKYPFKGNFMVFNMTLDISSRSDLFKNRSIKQLSVKNPEVNRLLEFEYISHCNKDGILIKDK